METRFFNPKDTEMLDKMMVEHGVKVDDALYVSSPYSNLIFAAKNSPLKLISLSVGAVASTDKYLSITSPETPLAHCSIIPYGNGIEIVPVPRIKPFVGRVVIFKEKMTGILFGLTRETIIFQVTTQTPLRYTLVIDRPK